MQVEEQATVRFEEMGCVLVRVSLQTEHGECDNDGGDNDAGIT